MKIEINNPEAFNYYKEKCSKNYMKDFNPDKFRAAIKKLGSNLSNNRRQRHLIVKINYSEDMETCADRKLYSYEAELVWPEVGKRAIERGYYYIKIIKNHEPFWVPVSCSLTDNLFRRMCTPSGAGEKDFKRFVFKMPYYYRELLVEDEEISKGAYLFHNRVIALSESPDSHVLCMDIDCHNRDIFHTENVLYHVLKELDFPKIIFAERSINGGYHVYVQTEKHVPDETKNLMVERFLKKYEKEKFTEFEMRTQNKPIRLPDSMSYRPVRLTVKDGECIEYMPYNSRNEWYEEVIKFNQPVSMEVIENFCKLQKKRRAKKTFIDEEDVQPNLTENLFTSQPQIQRGTIEIESDNQQMTMEKPTPTNSNNKIRYIGKRTNSKGDSNEELKITEGNRVKGNKMMFKIGFQYVAKGLGKDKYFQEILKHREDGSKDLKKWDERRIRKECDGIYDWCLNKVHGDKATKEKENNSDFSSNIGLIEGDNALMNLIEKFSSCMSKLYRTYPKQQQKYYQVTKVLVQEFIGKIIFERENPKYAYYTVTISYNKWKQSSSGYSLDRKTLKAIKNYYFPVGNNETDVNIIEIYNDIVYDGFLFIQNKYDYHGYDYVLGYCRQFDLAFSFSKDIFEELKYNFENSIRIMEKLIKIKENNRDIEKYINHEKRKFYFQSLLSLSLMYKDGTAQVYNLVTIENYYKNDVSLRFKKGNYFTHISLKDEYKNKFLKTDLLDISQLAVENIIVKAG